MHPSARRHAGPAAAAAAAAAGAASAHQPQPNVRVHLPGLLHCAEAPRPGKVDVKPTRQRSRSAPKRRCSEQRAAGARRGGKLTPAASLAALACVATNCRTSDN